MYTLFMIIVVACFQSSCT